jgi:PAS domain S-box-containing protein
VDFSGCMIPTMASAEQQRESLNIQLLVDSIPALIHTARPDGYLDYFNKPWLEYLGVTLDKVTGWNWTAVVHPEDVEGIVAKWRACLATGEVFEYETRVRRANGEYRWMFHRKVPLREANGNIVKWYGSSLDIEERKTAEEKLRRSERGLHSIIETIPTMVWSVAPALAEHGGFEGPPKMPTEPNLMQCCCGCVGVDAGIPGRKHSKSSLGLRVVPGKRFQQFDKSPRRDRYLVVL